MRKNQNEKSVVQAPVVAARPAARRFRRAMLEALEGRVLMAAGDVDPTFGQSGTAAGTFGGTAAVFAAVEVLGDGKILAAGTRTQSSGVESTSDFLVARYNS